MTQQNPITSQELFALIGMKEVEIYQYQKKIEELNTVIAQQNELLNTKTFTKLETQPKPTEAKE